MESKIKTHHPAMTTSEDQLQQKLQETAIRTANAHARLAELRVERAEMRTQYKEHEYKERAARQSLATARGFVRLQMLMDDAVANRVHHAIDIDTRIQEASKQGLDTAAMQAIANKEYGLVMEAPFLTMAMSYGMERLVTNIPSDAPRINRIQEELFGSVPPHLDPIAGLATVHVWRQLIRGTEEGVLHLQEGEEQFHEADRRRADREANKELFDMAMKKNATYQHKLALLAIIEQQRACITEAEKEDVIRRVFKLEDPTRPFGDVDRDSCCTLIGIGQELRACPCLSDTEKAQLVCKDCRSHKD